MSKSPSRKPRWVPFPLLPIVNGACACGGTDGCPGPGKHPATLWADLKAGDPIPRPVAGAGAGIKCGAEPYGSGVFVVEADSADAEAWLLAPERGLPETMTVLSGSRRGRHFYFWHPGFRVKTCAGQLHPKVDIRGDGGMVVAAGSPHKSGNRYEVDNPGPVADAPAWLLDWLRANQGPSRPAPKVRAPRAAAAGGESGDYTIDLGLRTMHPDGRTPWVLRELEPGKYAVRCPNETEHTNGGDTGTVAWAGGALHCSHAHCNHIRRTHLRTALGLWNPEDGWPELEAWLEERAARRQGPSEVETLRAYLAEVPPDALYTELGNVLAALGKLGEREPDGSRHADCPSGHRATVSARGRFKCSERSCVLRTKRDVLAALVLECAS